MPVAAAVAAAANTAPAAMSFACFAIGCMLGEAKSTTFSIAELKNSAVITNPATINTASHS